MGRSIALLLTAAIAAGAATAASAADLLPPPPPIEPPPLVEFSGWYLRGDVGVGALQGSNFRSSLTPDFTTGGLPNGPIVPAFASLGDSAFVGAGVGYQFNNWFRADITGEYRTQSQYRRGIAFAFTDGNGNVQTGSDLYSAGLRTGLFLLNGYLDLGTWYGVTPYVGAGVGFAAHNFRGLNDSGFGVAQDRDQTDFAWAVMAGLAFNVTPNLKMELSYRYVDLGNITGNPIQCLNAPCFHEKQSFRVASNDIRLGFRYAFIAPPPPIYPAPLITKY